MNKKETPRKCAARELRKESGLIALEGDLRFVGIMAFHNQREDGSEFTVRVFVFILNRWRGKLKPKEDEMVDPKWYKVKKLPFEIMAPSDIFWVPYIFDGKKIRGEAWHGPNQKNLLRTPKVKVVKSLSDIG